MKRALILVVIGSLFISLITPVFANEPKDKLSRGVANVLSAPLEILQNIDIEWKLSNNAATGIFAGLFKGLAWTCGRLMSGAWDILTFALPKPKDYNSIIQPEYVQRGVQSHFLNQEQK